MPFPNIVLHIKVIKWQNMPLPAKNYTSYQSHYIMILIWSMKKTFDLINGNIKKVWFMFFTCCFTSLYEKKTYIFVKLKRIWKTVQRGSQKIIRIFIYIQNVFVVDLHHINISVSKSELFHQNILSLIFCSEFHWILLLLKNVSG